MKGFFVKNRVKTAVLYALAIVLCACVSLDAAASSVKDLKNKQSGIVNDKKSVQSQLSEIRAEKYNMLLEINDIDAELEEVTSVYIFICEELERVIALKEQTETELAAARQEYEEQLLAFMEHVRYMHENGTTGYWEILLQSQSISDYFNRLEMINAVIDFDKTITDKLKSSEQLIAEKLLEIENEQLEIEALKRQQELSLEELNAKLAEKNSLLDALSSQEASYDQQLKYLDAEDSKIEKLIKNAEADELAKQKAANPTAVSTVYVGGQLMWPVPSYYSISSNYGYRIHPINKRKEFHKGIDIPAKTGSSVVAAGDGTVIFASYSGSYGKLVIVDHGGGISTAYAHNSQINVSVGQKVKKGDVVAKIGSTGASTGPHCHFEVRVNGSVQDPISYVKGK